MLRTAFYAACMLASMSDAVHITAANPPSGESVHGNELSQVDPTQLAQTEAPVLDKKALFKKFFVSLE